MQARVCCVFSVGRLAGDPVGRDQKALLYLVYVFCDAQGEA